jgi:hypothetical protein
MVNRAGNKTGGRQKGTKNKPKSHDQLLKVEVKKAVAKIAEKFVKQYSCANSATLQNQKSSKIAAQKRRRISGQEQVEQPELTKTQRFIPSYYYQRQEPEAKQSGYYPLKKTSKPKGNMTREELGHPTIAGQGFGTPIPTIHEVYQVEPAHRCEPRWGMDDLLSGIPPLPIVKSEELEPVKPALGGNPTGGGHLVER